MLVLLHYGMTILYLILSLILNELRSIDMSLSHASGKNGQKNIHRTIEGACVFIMHCHNDKMC